MPGDVAVTGFGDTTLAEACDPQLTSVRQPLAELGAQAAAALRAAIDAGRAQPRSAVLRAGLVVRGSTPRRHRAAGSEHRRARANEA